MGVFINKDPIDRRSWVRGYVVAISTVVKSHDIGTPAREALEAIGMDSTRKLRAAGVEEYDIDILRPIMREIRQHKRQK